MDRLKRVLKKLLKQIARSAKNFHSNYGKFQKRKILANKEMPKHDPLVIYIATLTSPTKLLAESPEKSRSNANFSSSCPEKNIQN